MPSESKPRRGRNRSKNAKNKSNSRVARRVARSKIQEDNDPVNLRHMGLIVLFLWVLAMLCFLVTSGNSGSSSPNGQILKFSESFEDLSMWDVLVDFFCPTTCIVKDNQMVNACNSGKPINKGECLRSKCCFSSFGNKMKCYYPIGDKPAQMLRIFGLILMLMVVLGFLPVYCCSLCQKSPWFNPLRRKINRIMMNLKKHRDKLQKDQKAKKAKEEETALLSR